MENNNGNQLVNPHYVDYGPDDRGYTHYGLTKREYFAGLAMQGIISNYFHQSQMSKGMNQAFANDAVALADALLTSLSRATDNTVK